MSRTLPVSARLFVVGAAVLLVGGAAVIGILRLRKPPDGSSDQSSGQAVAQGAGAAAPEESGVIEFPQASWQAASLRMEPARRAPFTQSFELTGKIAINEDRVAHIFPLVDGRVDEVKVKLGDKVRQGDLLVVVQSTEVGRSMLQLYQDRLQRDFAVTKDRWTQMIATNTQTMIQLIRQKASIEEIEKQLTDHPLGEYRDKLMSAYVAYYKAVKTFERVKPLSEAGAITGKQLLDAESEENATRATLQSLLEQLQQETKQAAILSAQSVKELETRVAVDETNLKILGFDDGSLVDVDPMSQGETISHYPITSPFDGTIITKDVVLLERVGPESQILSIADLSSVWVTTDVFEEHLHLLEELQNRKVVLRTPAWPGATFEAEIFYTGDLVHESTRTVAMRAIAANQDGRLHPGMFVTVEFPGVARENVLQVPQSAIQDHAGKTFVFVHVEGDRFERRDVSLGARNEDSVEIQQGLKEGDSVVVDGAFALKSRMLAELLAE